MLIDLKLSVSSILIHSNFYLNFQPADCKILIERLKSCSEDEILAELKKIETWTYGKCELYHWVDVLDLCDTILERACRKDHENSWVLACDLPQNQQVC